MAVFVNCLKAFTHHADTTDKALREQVRLAREAGHCWAEIGLTIGVTKQAAWERFGKE